MKPLLAMLAFCVLALVPPPAVAQEAQADRVAVRAATEPTRAGLVTFWEETLSGDPQVKKLEKTKEENVYDFETDFFPYKGRLKLLNAAVTNSDTEYYINLARGIVEIELMDAGEDFYKKYARSYGAWVQAQNYYFNMKRGIWFAPADWNLYAKDFDKYAEEAAAAPKGCTVKSFFGRYAGSIIPLSVFVLVVLLLLAFARKQNKRVWDNHAKALEEQQRGLKMVEESQKIAQESLKHQQEHTKLLQEILAAVKK